jgi:hypothetical protein
MGMKFKELYEEILGDSPIIGKGDIVKKHFPADYDEDKTERLVDLRNKNPEPGDRFQEQ